MPDGSIFISYRRDDSAGFTRAIYDKLAEHFPKDRIFMDVDTIEPGLPFDEVIDQAVGRCDIMLVMIGRRWLEPQPGTGPRLNNERDYVRLEIAAALSRNVRVIPVLLEEAEMPAEESLPQPIRALARRNAMEVGNTRFTTDVDRLVEVVGRVLGKAAPRAELPSRRRGLLWIGVAAVVIVIALGLLIGYLMPAGEHALVAPNLLSPADNTSFGQFPRTVTLVWEAVPAAKGYRVEIQFSSGTKETWSQLGSIARVNSTTYTFDFIGAQPGRWRVWAVDGKGQEGPKSDWWIFFFRQ